MVEVPSVGQIRRLRTALSFDFAHYCLHELIFNCYKNDFSSNCSLLACFVMPGVASRIFVGLVFLTVEPDPIDAFWAGDMIHYAVFLTSQSLTNRRSASSARDRSFLSWHGMPTASVKNKHFLN